MIYKWLKNKLSIYFKCSGYAVGYSSPKRADIIIRKQKTIFPGFVISQIFAI